MADDQIKISQLPTADTLSGAEEVPINQAGTTKKTTLAQSWQDSGYLGHAANEAIHREIDDAGTADTDLWSAEKIGDELALKADVSHTHSTSDLTAGTLPLTRGGLGFTTIAQNQFPFANTANNLVAGSFLPAHFDFSGSTVQLKDNATNQKLQILSSGTSIGTRPKLNLIGASGLSVLAVDNSGADRVDVTLSVSAANLPKRYINGPAPRYNNAASIILPTGLIARSSDNTTDIEVTTDLTVSLASSGANGLDTGSEASNTWYYVYLIINTSTGTVAGLFSTVNEAASGSVTLPSGYDKKRQLPYVVRNNGSSNILEMYVASGWPYRPVLVFSKMQTTSEYDATTITTGATSVLANGASASTWTAITLSSFIPPVARFGLFNAMMRGNSVAYLRPGDSSDYEVPIGAYAGAVSHAQVQCRIDLTDMSIDYLTYGGNTLDLGVAGFIITEI